MVTIFFILDVRYCLCGAIVIIPHHHDKQYFRKAPQVSRPPGLFLSQCCVILSLPLFLFFSAQLIKLRSSCFHSSVRAACPLVAKAPYSKDILRIRRLVLYLHSYSSDIHVHYLIVAVIALAPYVIEYT